MVAVELTLRVESGLLRHRDCLRAKITDYLLQLAVSGIAAALCTPRGLFWLRLGGARSMLLGKADQGDQRDS